MRGESPIVLTWEEWQRSRAKKRAVLKAAGLDAPSRRRHGWGSSERRLQKAFGPARAPVVALSAALIFGLATLCGCNSYDVRALKYDPGMKIVTVVNNPQVRVADFENVLQDEFGTRGVAVRVVPANHTAKPGEYVITYDARQSWDFATYLSDATVRVEKDNLPVGKGHYHHNGGSASLSLWKWQGTQTKMAPLYEELLKEWNVQKHK